MLKVSCDYGVCDVEATGDGKKIVSDAICIILAIDEGLASKNPAAQNVFRDMLKDEKFFEKFGKAKQATVNKTEKTKKIAEKVIELRKEIENHD